MSLRVKSKHALELLVVSGGLQRDRDILLGAIPPEPAMLAIESRLDFARVLVHLSSFAVTVIEILGRIDGIAMRIEVHGATLCSPYIAHGSALLHGEFDFGALPGP